MALSKVVNMVAFNILALFLLCCLTVRGDYGLGDLPAPSPGGSPAPGYNPAPDIIVVPDNPAPDSEATVPAFQPAPFFYTVSEYELFIAEGTTVCDTSTLVDQPCKASSPCTLEECTESCTASDTCKYLSINENGGCSLYEDCSTTRTVALNAEVWFRSVLTYDNWGDQVTSQAAFVEETAYAEIYSSSTTTCSNDYKIEQKCTTTNSCSVEECEDYCTADDDCWFIFSLQTGGCFLYTNCEETRTSGAAGSTLVKGVTTQCDGVVVDYDAISAANSQPYDDNYDILFADSTTTCSTTFKLSQPCTASAACSDADCVAACTDDSACTHAFSLNAGADGGCILYSSCDQTRESGAAGNTFSKLTSRRNLQSRRRLQDILRELSPFSNPCPPDPIRDDEVVYSDSTTTCSTDYKLSQPCNANNPCSTSDCFNSCLDDADCSFFLHIGDLEVDGGCMLYSSCDSVRTAGTNGYTFEVVETYPTTTQDPNIEPEPECKYAEYCVFDNMFQTKKACGNIEIERTCSNGNPCDLEECTNLCNLFDGCEYVRHSVLGACLLFDECVDTKTLVFKGTTYQKPHDFTTEEKTTTTTTTTTITATAIATTTTTMATTVTATITVTTLTASTTTTTPKTVTTTTTKTSVTTPSTHVTTAASSSTTANATIAAALTTMIAALHETSTPDSDTDSDGVSNYEDSCQFDADNDVDSDSLCGDVDSCPLSTLNDIDQDGICFILDSCPVAYTNDADSDFVCDDVDSCLDDAINDPDSDYICSVRDSCPHDSRNDFDDDALCMDQDSCPNDAANDADSDVICGDVDSCPYDANNDVDDDNLCFSDDCWDHLGVSCAQYLGLKEGQCRQDNMCIACGCTCFNECQDLCPFDPDNDVDSDSLCGDEDNCPLDPDNDIDADNLCSNEDSCALDAANDFDSDDICGNIDSCEFDPYNDADSDLVCSPDDVCQFDDEHDADSDDICGDVDSCPYDAGNDFDSDALCADIDSCPLDADNDFDDDAICGNIDHCPFDSHNDADVDLLCGDVDSCPNDLDNDIDSDLVCGDRDSCTYDSSNDIDSDNICGDVDSCSFDGVNDMDSDFICADVDSCPFDELNDADSDSVCANEDICPLDSLNDIDSDALCANFDSCPFDALNDIDGDEICQSSDSCPFDHDNDIDSDSLCSDAYPSFDTAVYVKLQRLCFSGDLAEILAANFGYVVVFDKNLSKFWHDDTNHSVSANVVLTITASLFNDVESFETLRDLIAHELGVEPRFTTVSVVVETANDRRRVLAEYFGRLEVAISIAFGECFNDDGGRDADSDTICFDVDSCPYDSSNDIDSDGICQDVDSCPADRFNDWDSDLLCVHELTSCVDDSNLDVGFGSCATYAQGRVNFGMCQVDGLCEQCGCSCLEECSDHCPLDSSNDVDSDLVCGDIDSCPLDAEDDSDSDNICDSLDSCPQDMANDRDADGICFATDSCPDDVANDADSDQICGDVDSCPSGLPGPGGCVALSSNEPTTVNTENTTTMVAAVVSVLFGIVIVFVLVWFFVCRARLSHPATKVHPHDAQTNLADSMSSGRNSSRVDSEISATAILADVVNRGGTSTDQDIVAKPANSNGSGSQHLLRSAHKGKARVAPASIVVGPSSRRSRDTRSRLDPFEPKRAENALSDFGLNQDEPIVPIHSPVADLVDTSNSSNGSEISKVSRSAGGNTVNNVPIVDQLKAAIWANNTAQPIAVKISGEIGNKQSTNNKTLPLVKLPPVRPERKRIVGSRRKRARRRNRKSKSSTKPSEILVPEKASPTSPTITHVDMRHKLNIDTSDDTVEVSRVWLGVKPGQRRRPARKKLDSLILVDTESTDASNAPSM